MPVTLMGFDLQGFSLTQSLLTLSSQASLLSFPAGTNPKVHVRPRDFRAFLPVRVRHSLERSESLKKAAALLVFMPSREFSLTAVETPSRLLPSWASFPPQASSKLQLPYRVSPNGKVG
jgi:hypothetical protein